MASKSIALFSLNVNQTAKQPRRPWRTEFTPCISLLWKATNRPHFGVTGTCTKVKVRRFTILYKYRKISRVVVGPEKFAANEVTGKNENKCSLQIECVTRSERVLRWNFLVRVQNDPIWFEIYPNAGATYDALAFIPVTVVEMWIVTPWWRRNYVWHRSLDNIIWVRINNSTDVCLTNHKIRHVKIELGKLKYALNIDSHVTRCL